MVIYKELVKMELLVTKKAIKVWWIIQIWWRFSIVVRANAIILENWCENDKII